MRLEIGRGAASEPEGQAALAEARAQGALREIVQVLFVEDVVRERARAVSEDA